MPTAAAPTIDPRHNRPPMELYSPEDLRARLAEDHGPLLVRRDELLDAEGRVPAITDDEVAGRVSDYIRQVSAAAKAADGSRVAAKEPYLAAGRVVDGFFKSVIDPLEAAKRRVSGRLTEYLRDKEARERREREEAERLARAEAERARREAEEAAARLTTEAELTDAVDAERRAEAARADEEQARKAAAAKAAELSRVRGDYGALSSLRTEWTFADLDREALDLEALRQHLPHDGLERAIRSYIRAGGRALRGVRIYETTAAVVR